MRYRVAVPATQHVTIDELGSADYALLGELTHASLAEFVVEYFLRRGSWLTRVHHAMSIATLTAIVVLVMEQHHSLLACLRDFGLAMLTVVVVLLPLHELLHAIGYKLVGAHDIRWDYSRRMLAVWVIAHHYVADARAFAIVALAPFVVLNTVLIAAAFLWPGIAIYLLFVLLWHLHGSSGDWALLNFVWLHRARGFWTYDDADAGRSWFYGRSH